VSRQKLVEAPATSPEAPKVEQEALDYPEALARLTAMIGRRVEITVRGVASKPPILLDLEGVLQQTDQVEDAETIGWDPEALRLAVGDARLTLHPRPLHRCDPYAHPLTAVG
jgi:hypothetical protein